ADAADRGHRVRGIADAKKPRPVPPRKPVHRHGQKLDLIPILELTDPVGENWREPRDALPEGRQSSALRLFDRTLANDKRALPVVAAIEHDHDAPGLEPAHGLVGVARFLR